MTTEAPTGTAARISRPGPPPRGLVNTSKVPSSRDLRRPLLLGREPVVARLGDGESEEDALVVSRSAGLSATIEPRSE